MSVIVNPAYVSSTVFICDGDVEYVLQFGVKLSFGQGVDGISVAAVKNTSVAAGQTTCEIDKAILTPNLSYVNVSFVSPPSSPGVTFLDKGVWALYTEYEVGHFVEDYGSTWRCIVSHIASSNNRPSEGADSTIYWIVMARRGNDGAYIEVDFDYDTTSPLTISSVSLGDTVLKAAIAVKTAFDDALATLKLGHTGNPNALIADSENIPQEEALFSLSPNIEYGGADSIYLTIDPASSTQGSGTVILQINRQGG